MTKLKIRKIGNGVGVVLPTELIAHLGVQVGDSLVVTRTASGIELHATETDAQLAAARLVMARRRRALGELAKG